MILLHADDLDSLDLEDWGLGYVTTSVDIGTPDLREVTQNLPDADGTLDLTQRVGARAITMSVALLDGPWAAQDLYDQLAPFLAAGRRVTLEVGTTADRPGRRIVARRGGDVNQPWRRPGQVVLALPWRTVGYPFWLGEEHTLDVAARPPAPGIIPPLTPPITVPVNPDDSRTATNLGNQPAHWTAVVNGPCRVPRLRNETTGEEVVLTGLNLLAGQTAVVDSFAKSVTVDGTSRAASTGSKWWQLAPGESRLSVPAATSSAPATASFSWSDTYL